MAKSIRPLTAGTFEFNILTGEAIVSGDLDLVHPFCASWKSSQFQKTRT